MLTNEEKLLDELYTKWLEDHFADPRNMTIGHLASGHSALIQRVWLAAKQFHAPQWVEVGEDGPWPDDPGYYFITAFGKTFVDEWCYSDNGPWFWAIRLNEEVAAWSPLRPPEPFKKGGMR